MPSEGVLRLGVFHAFNLQGFSGIPLNLITALNRIDAVEVINLPYLNPYDPPFPKRIRKRVKRGLFNTQYLWEKEPARCRHLSMKLDEATENHQVEAVLLFGSEGCAFSQSCVPVYCYGDSIFGTRVDLYSDQARIETESLREGIQMQQRALDRLSRMFISSQWAWDRALNHFDYKVADVQCQVLGIGANIPEWPASVSAVEATDPAHFMWVGVDWHRKGGAFALEVTRALRERGCKAYLHIVGPAPDTREEQWIKCYGKLDYTRPQDFKTLSDLYRKSVALLLPTRADITPIAIAEATAFGRPAIASTVGGIPEMIDQGKTGYALPLSSPRDWADKIAVSLGTLASSETCMACRRSFEERFNWDVIANAMLASISADRR